MIEAAGPEAMGLVEETWAAWGNQGKARERTGAEGRRGSRVQKALRLVRVKRRAGGPWVVSQMASLASSSVLSQRVHGLGWPAIECLVGLLRDGDAVLQVAVARVSYGVPDQARDHPQYQLVANLVIASDAASSEAALGFAAQVLEVGREVPAEREFAAVEELRILEGVLDDLEGKGEVLEAFRVVQVACLEILEDPFVVQWILGLLMPEHPASLLQGPQH